ncbi:transporter substrate-binding domain-containing protein [Mesobacterium pallidum]|uniref:transporter substrate-binding domain-containing protein n=1 Tax=Mesobacterium pallidum TaxID=2872037 RepID=UPI001EE1C39E|nr:transporter substrate-binding domain-containing protein [Mesobacterium pallidum]
MGTMRIWVCLRAVCLAVLAWAGASGVQAQDAPLRMITVDRPPFSMEIGGERTGFSIELMEAVAELLGREVTFTVSPTFGGMFTAVNAGEVDGAVANISITAAREETLDFSQPIFESGIGILVPDNGAGNSGMLATLFTWDIFFLVIAAFGLLFAMGMAMWVFERKRQAYFDRPARDAMFPAFWYALNLVVNGGFEERMPQSPLGRLTSVLMVVSSLFIVSVFVAHITAAMTVEAITNTVDNVSDLDGRIVGTTEGSTASRYLSDLGIAHRTFDSFAALTAGYESNDLDAIVFDKPLLNYYVRTGGNARVVDRVFKPEDYGIAFDQGSPLTEEINRALLALREDGTHDEIYARWFGATR